MLVAVAVVAAVVVSVAGWQAVRWNDGAGGRCCVSDSRWIWEGCESCPLVRLKRVCLYQKERMKKSRNE